MSTVRVKVLRGTGTEACGYIGRRRRRMQPEFSLSRLGPEKRGIIRVDYQGEGNRPIKLESVESLDRGNEYLGGQLLLRRCSRIVDIMFDAVVIPKRDLSLGNDLKNAPRCCG
jgi:hypothetical protein